MTSSNFIFYMSQEHYLFQLALYAVTALNFLITALNFRRCTITSKYSGKAKYFKCANPLRGIAVYIEMRDQNTPETLQLCEVEVFQTTTSEQKQSGDMYSTFKVQHERGTDHEFFFPLRKKWRAHAISAWLFKFDHSASVHSHDNQNSGIIFFLS